MSVTRRDLRPLPGVTLQLAGAVNRQEVTEENGRVVFAALPTVGAITITPSRSGFRFEPPQLTIPDLAKPSAPAFFAFPTATDLAVSIAGDDAAPLVGQSANTVITLRNLGTEAATDVSVGFASPPGLDLEAADSTAGRLEFQAYQTVWHLPQFDPGASAEVRLRSRATLPDANVLTVAVVDEMDQTDTNPLNNSAELIIRPRAATARLSLAMTIDPSTAKVGGWVPVQLTVRNEGPDDATQVNLLTYLPPGASLVVPDKGGLSSRLVIPRLTPGAEMQFVAAMVVLFTGKFTLIANATYLEEQLAQGSAWPEARADFTVEPAFAQLSLSAFTDPPNPRVGQEVNVFYVAKNEGPDPVSGLQLFTREDPRLDTPLTVDLNHAPPPVPGPFSFGDVLPVGSYTYYAFRYRVKGAGDLTNYFTVEYQDQLVPNAQDHPELLIPIKTLPSDIGLSLDANPKEITVRAGEPVTIEFPIHNDGPHAATSFFVDFDSTGLILADLDEVIHNDRVDRPTFAGYINVLQAEETAVLRKHFIASLPGDYTNYAQIKLSSERPDLIMPIAWEAVRLHVLPGLPPDLAIALNVDKSTINVGEYAIFIVTVTNRADQPAFNVQVRETDGVSDVDLAFETVRSYGPGGDDRTTLASQRTIPRLDPGASYSMSRTMRMRKPLTINYFAKIIGVNGLSEADLPSWFATTNVTGVQIASDIAPVATADRTNVKNGDLVNSVIADRNLSPHVASNIGVVGGVGAGFQALRAELGNYGYYYDWNRPKDLQSGAGPLSQWKEISSLLVGYTFFSAYTVSDGQLTMAAQLSELDQLDAQAENNLTQVHINSAPASARVTVRQSPLGPSATIGNFMPFVTEIRNEGPDRVTGLALLETVSPNLELTYNSAVTGSSGPLATSFLDSFVRLPPLEPGQNFIWQRTYAVRSVGNASRTVRVAGFDQTSMGPLAENTATINVEPAQADIELQFLDAPTVAEASMPTPVNVRVRNLGPATATRVKVNVAVPDDALSLSGFGYGPRASIDWLSSNTFTTQLLPGESSIVGFLVTPAREGPATVLVRVVQADQADPHPANDSLSLTLNASPAPPLPNILRVSKVRTDFFDHTPIAEIEVDQTALDRYAPFTSFWLEGSSNLLDWERLGLFGILGRGPATLTDHAGPGVKTRAYRLQR